MNPVNVGAELEGFGALANPVGVGYMGAADVDADQHIVDQEGAAGVAVVGGAVDSFDLVGGVPVGVEFFLDLFDFCPAEPGHGFAACASAVAVDVAAFLGGELVVGCEGGVLLELLGLGELDEGQVCSWGAQDGAGADGVAGVEFVVGEVDPGGGGAGGVFDAVGGGDDPGGADGAGGAAVVAVVGALGDELDDVVGVGFLAAGDCCGGGGGAKEGACEEEGECGLGAHSNLSSYFK